MIINSNSKNAIKPFKHILQFPISDNNDDGIVDLFLFPINARNFDDECVASNLLESVADYALSWSYRENNKDKTMLISQQARAKFRDLQNNKGELGELLLFCFLEGYLEAPKILTKLELKTSNQMYVNGSDGIHLKKISDNRYHLIFGESKMYKDLSVAFKKAFKSIYDFKNEINSSGVSKSGIAFEKGLISRHIDNAMFNDDEEELVNILLYPNNKATTNMILDDAFSIFIGYEIDISEEQKKFSNEDFPHKIEEKIKKQIETFKDKIYDFICNNQLLGHTFYVFIVPFANIDASRKKILGKVLG